MRIISIIFHSNNLLSRRSNQRVCSSINVKTCDSQSEKNRIDGYTIIYSTAIFTGVLINYTYNKNVLIWQHSFILSFFLFLSLSLSLSVLDTYILSPYRSHPFAYKTLRYLTRSNITVRTRATLSSKIRARETQSYINAYQAAIWNAKRFDRRIGRSLKRRIPHRNFLTYNERRFEKELCILPVFCISCSVVGCLTFSKKYKQDERELT